MLTATTMSSSGSRLVYDTWGASERQFLLVHGLSSNAQTWWQVAAILTDRGFGAITVDQRSHGRSDVSDDGYQWATMAEDLRLVLVAAGADRVVVAGQSWGASVVLGFAHRHPEACLGVIGVDGGHAALRSRFPDWETCAAMLRPAEIPAVTRETMREYVAQAHPHWSPAGVEHTVANFREDNGLLVRALPIPHHMQIVKELWDHDPVAIVEELHVPSAIISAGADPAGVDVASELISLPGDHDLHVEQPEAVADVLIERYERWDD